MSYTPAPDTDTKNTMDHEERAAACALRFAGLHSSIAILPDQWADLFHVVGPNGTVLVGHRRVEAPWILPPHSYVYSVFSTNQEPLFASTDGYNAETTTAFLNTHLAP